MQIINRKKGGEGMQMLINGQETGAKGEEVLSVINPATMEVIDHVPMAADEDVERALDAAQAVKKEWRKVPLYRRIEILLKFTELLEKNRKEFIHLMCSETGKPLAACDDETSACINIFKAYCEKARNYGGKTMPLDSEPRVEGDIIMNVREPLGVVVSIVPFNYPTELYAHKVAPALVTGNVVIVKPSSDTPLGNIYLTRLLSEAGVIPGAIQIVTGSGGLVGNRLSSSPKVDAISLTGSTAVGIITAKNAADNLAHVGLELGGNDAFIIFDDADLDQAVTESLAGRMSNTGQTCCGSKRFLVHNKVKEAYTEKLIEALKQVKEGDPLNPETQCGPLISESAAKSVEQQVEKTLAQGAALALGGKRYSHTFFEMTVLTGVTKDMDIAKDMEVFGPVFPIIGFDTVEEAIEIANGGCYGLSSGVMTKDMTKALTVAANIEAGTCVINGCGNYRSAHLPFGGCKMTGIGREGVTETLDEYTQIKNIAFKGLIR